jgi:hypothetical protein
MTATVNRLIKREWYARKNVTTFLPSPEGGDLVPVVNVAAGNDGSKEA